MPGTSWARAHECRGGDGYLWTGVIMEGFGGKAVSEQSPEDTLSVKPYNSLGSLLLLLWHESHSLAFT